MFRQKKNIKILKTQKTYLSKVIGRIYPIVDDVFAILAKSNGEKTTRVRVRSSGLKRMLKRREKEINRERTNIPKHF